jgi:uncharacterized Zn finger protein (UPF0148 family)
MALNESLKCPACSFTADQGFTECPKCGVIVQKYYKSIENKKEREKIELQKKAAAANASRKVNDAFKVGGAGFLYGLTVAFFGICIGVFIMMIPIIGWVLGPIIILGSLAFPFMSGAFGMKAGISYSGGITLRKPCPYCGGVVAVNLKVSDSGKVFGMDCPVCKKRFVVKGQSFHAV